ncbi:MAG: hypothetical protein WC058_11475 [Phycisphaeraceae bacterium]
MGALQNRSGKLQNASQFPFIHFLMNREYCDEDGLWNPRESDPPLEDAFQINVFGSREHYLKLADMLRAFAERDTGDDGDYHEHFDRITSVDGNANQSDSTKR